MILGLICLQLFINLGENKFEKKLQDTTCYERTDVSFDVKVTDPKAEVKWFHKGKEILDGEKYQIKSLGNGVHKMTIKNAQADDEGEIKVRYFLGGGEIDGSKIVTIKNIERGIKN